MRVPHASPLRKAFHSGTEQEISCFTSITLLENDGCEPKLVLTALEYSRKRRKQLVQQEFGAWLVRNCVKEAVMAAKPNVEIVFWNRHAAELYQWTEEEALYMNVSSLAAPDFLEQQQKDIATMTKGENQKRLFKVRRKDHTMFMAYVSDAAIMNGDELEYMVGVSSDQQALYDAMTELQHIKKNLNQESESRLAQLVKAESVALSQARATEEAQARSEVAIQTMSMFSHELRTPVQVRTHDVITDNAIVTLSFSLLLCSLVLRE